MLRRLGVLALLLIAASTSGQADQGPLFVASPAKPAVAPAPEVPDLTGPWIGMIVVPEKDKRTPNALQVVLKQTGGTLTGTAGSSKMQTALTNGRVESTKFGTSLSFNLPGPNSSMEFQLRLDQGVLRGAARLPNVTAAASVELHRVDTNPLAKALNLSGTWLGAFGLANAEHLVHVVLEQSGATLTGTAGPHAYKQIPITAGKVATTEAGTTVSFQMDMSADGVVMQFELTLTETGLKGTVTVSHNGEQISGPVELIPVKSTNN